MTEVFSVLWVLIGFVQLVVGVIAAYFFLTATVFLEATLAAPTLASAVALASVIWLIGMLGCWTQTSTSAQA